MSKITGFSALLATATLYGCTFHGVNAQIPQKTPMKATSSSLLKAPRTTRSFAKIETQFQIPNFSGDAFDFTKNDVRAEIRLPDGKSLSLPAFYDGGQTWRVRHTPGVAGRYAVAALTLNGQKLNAKAEPQGWIVNGQSEAGFVRIDAKNRRRFLFDNGTRYYPLGTNQAWLTGKTGEYGPRFTKTSASGQNWSRIWMNHWDGKNLDWGNGEKIVELGQIDVNVARRWDEILTAAERTGTYFQLVFQHHGQYSSSVNPNWGENPYNVKNGGFLQTPTDFFTDERARDLTKRKLRYSIARFGYSPSIMAWELWNEVQFTDAAREKKWDIVAQWHREMSDFLRAQDAYNHLITTSSEAPPEVFTASDFYQRHAYPTNLIGNLSHSGFEGEEWAPRPAFVGEFGDDSTRDRPDQWTMHSGLWAGLLSDSAGAAQYWYNDKVEKFNWYGHFSAASGFLKSAGFSARDQKNAVIPAKVQIETPGRGSLSLSPGGDWGQALQSNFDLTNPEDVAAFDRLPRYFQGQNHRALNPKPLILQVDAPQAGELKIRLATIAKAGANLKVTVAGTTTDFAFPAMENDLNQAKDLIVPIQAGAQTISIENSGQDWVVLREVSVPGAAMLLNGLAKAAPGFAMAWFYHVGNIELDKPVGDSTGRATILGVRPGVYNVVWWDTLAGKALKTETTRADEDGLKLQIPPVSRDIAMWAVAR